MDQTGTETVFSGKLFDVAVRRYRGADGGEYERQVVEHPGAVGIVAHDERFVYLVRQPREAVGEARLLEMPAGTMDIDEESELECAARELREEVGLTAERWRVLRAVYPSPGWASEKITIFAATGLSQGPTAPDQDERIEIARLPLTELGRVLEEVRDAKTLIGLLLLADELRGSGASSA